MNVNHYHLYISKWNINNVTNMNYILIECYNLIISERTKRKFKL